MRRLGGPMTTDAVVAGGFVLAAVGDAIALHHGDPGLLGFAVCGALVLAVLTLRRTRPVVPICVITGAGALGATVQTLAWPGAENDGGVWLFALMLAAYSLGAHGPSRARALGWLAPLAVGVAVDVPTMAGWSLVSSVLFLTFFVGLLPTTAGWLTRVWRKRLALLNHQRDILVREQRSGPEAAALAERLRATEQLQVVLLDGLRSLGRAAAAGAAPGEIERDARQLLGGVRTQVVTLTEPLAVGVPPTQLPTANPASLRVAAQRWVVLGAGVIGIGLAVEPARATETSALVLVTASMVVCLPLALLWWRPLPALVVAWCAATGFSRWIAPLDGTLSGTAFALGTAFAIAALCHRRVAVVGLATCLVGQIVGVAAADPLGEGTMVSLCWFGGLVAGEVGRLVDRGRENNRLLAEAEERARQLAVVGERLRLAREVHDQVGHSLTVVALQAGAARRMAQTEPDRARQVMGTIVCVIQDGLAAMAGEDPHDLAAVVQRTRDAGLTVTTDLSGLARCGPADAPLLTMAHRVVQETLTNVLRHAPGAAAAVVIRRDSGTVTVRIRNGASGRGPQSPGSGRGLAGLQSLVSESGGQLCWGTSSEGGFEVCAQLPVHQLEGALR